MGWLGLEINSGPFFDFCNNWGLITTNETMKRIIMILLIVITGADQLGAQHKETSSLLWEISGNSLSKPSYLFGTFHLMCATDFSIGKVLNEKLNSAEQFYGELDMSKPNWQNEMAMSLIMKDQTIEGLMGKQDFEKANKKFKEITGMDLNLLNNAKPFMSISLLTLNTLPCSDKIQPETMFINIVNQHKTPVFGLETITDQMNALDTQPIDSQINSLKKMIFNFDSVKIEMRKMIDVYQLKNIDSLYNYMKQNGADGQFEQELLINRNLNWIPVITKAINHKSSFFAVGAGHLGGETGLLNLLRKEGYHIKAINY
ncbi:MAG: TraB/GumN family protein [Sphingobacteriia bacterium]|nr:MAG: TraB/GumN family protein [Sphingobacteriia bacterium]